MEVCISKVNRETVESESSTDVASRNAESTWPVVSFTLPDTTIALSLGL